MYFITHYCVKTTNELELISLMSYCFVFKSLFLLTGSFSGLVSVKNLIRNKLKRQSPKSLVGNVLVPFNWIVMSFHVTLMTFIIIRLWSQHHNTQCLIKQHEVRKNSRAHIKQNVIIFIDRFKVWVKAKQQMFWPLTNRTGLTFLFFLNVWINKIPALCYSAKSTQMKNTVGDD